MSFVHLHVHSHYSFHDGAASPIKLIEKAKHFGMPALALTDHNRLAGAIRFYDSARKNGIKPIIGAEIQLGEDYHLTLLCKDMMGYSNLCRILTIMHCNNHGSATHDMLACHNKGLIALSGCSMGEIPALLGKGDRINAVRSTEFYREVFRDDFFIELCRYPSGKGTALCYALASFAREKGVPCVATNNVHYVEMKDYRITELLNAIGHNVPVSQLPEPRTVERYFKSPAEMKRLFKDFPDAVNMSLEIAGRCNLDLELGKPHFPKFDLPPGETASGFLRRLSYEGVKKKYANLTDQVTSRLAMELGTIKSLGFCSYFLVVWDIVCWARAHGIRCQARGSAVDSLVVYALDISVVDPIHYNLLFERFMHPLRNEPPDIDLDIDRQRRDEVRDYVYQKYGVDNVSCVATISTYLARGAIRNAGKALQLPKATINGACKGIHWLSVSKLMEKAGTLPELKDNPVYKKPELKGFFELCAAIDGFPKHLSVHLGGLLIGEGHLSDLVPLEPSSGGDIISQYDKDDIARLGLVKMDLLSLPTITVIDETVRSIKKSCGIDIDIDNIPRDDPAPYDMLRNGRTIGVFQLESSAQREMAGRLLPETFDDIIITLSLVRPGPLKSDMDKSYLARRHGKEPVSYIHPNLEEALRETMGVILYQEQVLRVAHDLAGLSYAEADGFRRAMTHDRPKEEMEKMRLSFICSAMRRDISRGVAEKVFEQLAAFAAYGFCKAHAVAYAVLSYQTLWLKCHYPAEFLAAVLSNQPIGEYPPRVILAEARHAGVKVLAPDVNSSLDHYSVEGGAIRIGLSQVKGITREAVTSIMNERENRRFASLRDFIMRVQASESIIGNLVKIGALDSMGNREEMLKEISDLLQFKHCNVKDRLELVGDILPCAIPEIATSSFDKRASMLVERKLLSLDLSAHPLDFYDLGNGFTRIEDLPLLKTGQAVKIAGAVIRYQQPPTRTGKRVVYIIMEDGTGIADITVFSNTQERSGGVLFQEGWLAVEGKIQRRGPKSLSIIASSIYPLQWE